MDEPTDLSPPRGTRPVVNAFVCIGVAVAANVVLLLLFVMVDVTLGIERGTRAASVVGATNLLVASAANLAVFIWFAHDRAGWSAVDLGLRRAPSFWPAVGATALAYLGYFVLAASWIGIVGPPSRRHTLLQTVEERPPLFVIGALLIGACVAAPIVEELLFRGFLYRALTGWRGHLPAALLSSAVFGVLHAAVVPPVTLVPLAAFGFVLCALYRHTGSLLPGMGLHAFQNSLATGLAAGYRAWTVALIGGSWLTIWLVLTPWRRAAPAIRPGRADGRSRQARNRGLPDWARGGSVGAGGDGDDGGGRDGTPGPE